MHTEQTKTDFVKLRAQGWSFSRISAQLRVSKPTLIAWNRQCQSRLQSPRAVELKALQESLLPEEEFLRSTLFLRAIEQELAARALRDIPTAQLHRYAALLRDRLNELHPVKERSNDRLNPVNSRQA